MTKHRWLFAACLCAGLPLFLGAQTLQVTPDHLLSDETATITATGLRPNEEISIQAELTDGAGNRWSSSAKFLADSQGTVDLSRQAPAKGSYSEVSAMGLVWSMKPEQNHVAVYVPPRDFDAQIIELRLNRGRQTLSRVRLEQRFIAENVRQVKVRGDLHGVLFEPADSSRHHGILVVGGSEGGIPFQKAAWLASRGYAAFALVYFRYENLSPDLEAIPLEYFGIALNWMTRRTEILPGGVAVMGTSRGGELALQLAATYPQVRAVVAYVPSNVRYPACCGNTKVPYAWTLHGQPLAYVTPREAQGDPAAAMQAAIPIEHAHGPILLISGEDDGVWASTRMSEQIVARLKAAHYSFAVEHLQYPHAGHLAARPEIVPAWHGVVRHPVSGREMNFGGTPQGEAQSSLDAIPKVLAFLRDSFSAAVPGPAQTP